MIVEVRKQHWSNIFWDALSSVPLVFGLGLVSWLRWRWGEMIEVTSLFRILFLALAGFMVVLLLSQFCKRSVLYTKEIGNEILVKKFSYRKNGIWCPIETDEPVCAVLREDLK